MQRSALCRSRRELSNAYLLAKFRFDTAENEPAKNLQNLLIFPISLTLTLAQVRDPRALDAAVDAYLERRGSSWPAADGKL